MKALGWIVAILVVLFIIGSIAGNGSNSTSTASASTSTSGSSSSSETSGGSMSVEDAGPKWLVNDYTDEISGTVTHTASIESDETFTSSMGMGGHEVTTLTIRHRGAHNEVTIENKNLQILCDEYHSPLRVKFDSGKPQSFSCSESSTHDFGFGFINSPARFIAGLRHAKKVAMEAPVFDRGNFVMHFDVPSKYPFGGDTPAHPKVTKAKHVVDPNPDEAQVAATAPADHAARNN